MTRVLSELLGVNPPVFLRGLQKLEQASGHTNTDIQLTTDIMHATQRKLHLLGLDKKDTIAPELYAALGVRLKHDEERLFKSLRSRYGEHGDLQLVVQALEDVPIPKSCFALKSASAKRLLKKEIPKRAMKQLGYRSFESMLKHEHIAEIYAACQLYETAAWHRHLLEAYKKLQAPDFEIREMRVLHPNTTRWQKIAETAVAQQRHNVLGFKELGAVVLLPLPDHKPPAAGLISMLLALQQMNEIRAAGTYLKLCQVKPNFGAIVQHVVQDEPALSPGMFDRPLPWQVVQRYYGRFTDRFRSEVFEPHVQPDDLTWHSIEKVLSYFDPALDFWRQTMHLGLLENHEAVSLNIIDVAINYCNQLPFEQRVLKYCRQSLWHELVIRYLKHENVEQTIARGLQSELTAETEMA